MSDKVEVKIIEVAAEELKPGSKYIFLLEPMYASAVLVARLKESLAELIGPNFMIVPLPKDALKVYAIQQGDAETATRRPEGKR